MFGQASEIGLDVNVSRKGNNPRQPAVVVHSKPRLVRFGAVLLSVREMKPPGKWGRPRHRGSGLVEEGIRGDATATANQSCIRKSDPLFPDTIHSSAGCADPHYHDCLVVWLTTDRLEQAHHKAKPLIRCSAPG